MLMFAYWAKTKEGVSVNFMSENFYEEGTVVEYQGKEVVIEDLAVEKDTISCMELNMAMEDMRWQS